MINRILVLVYKENSTLWFPSGNTRNISCNHQYLGVFGINMRSEEVPIPTSTVPPELGGGEGNESAQFIVLPGNVYVNTTEFGDAGFKVVVKVKDMETGIVSWIDAADYAANIALCNFVPAAGFCPLVTALTTGSLSATGATITWAAVPGSVGIEYINNTSSTAPVVTGTYLGAATTSKAITGLTTATAYHFWIRTICPGGTLSAWASVVYTTS